MHVWDARGRRYLDLLGGLAVASTGHAHPHVVEALQEQARTLLHVSNLYATPANVSLAQRLTHRTGHDRAAFLNSGGEANELALKIFRRHGHEGGGSGGTVLAFEGSFHGRSLGALSLTGQPGKREGFGPLLPGVEVVPFDDPEALKDAFRAHDVAGAFYEPIQGEGGVRPLSPGTAAALDDLADDHDALLVADEVQTGVGRTGTFLASDPLPLEPDLVTLAKGIASGVPMGVTLASGPAADLLGPGDHGCTFGGGPLASAAAHATLDVLDDEALLERARETGAVLADRLEGALAPADPDVRGRGLLLGAALEEADPAAVAEAARQAGVLVGTAGDDVLRLAPPLVAEPGHAEAGAAALADAVTADAVTADPPTA